MGITIPNEERKSDIDILKGILIALTVAGHTYIESQWIFWFHMPLFFIISGYLLKTGTKNQPIKYFKDKAIQLFIPYFVFGISEMLIFHKLSVLNILKLIYGGRTQEGVYWYITCYFLSLIAIYFIENNSGGGVKRLIYILLFSFAIAESVVLVPDNINDFPNYLLTPWNIDVSALAVVYMGIGLHGKNIINSIRYSKKKIRLINGCVLSLLIICLYCLLDYYGIYSYTMNMKHSLYRDPVAAILLPFAFGYILLLLSRLLGYIKIVGKGLSLIGKNSMIIMYTHIPIREIFISIYGEKYSLAIYILIVMLASVTIGLLVNYVKQGFLIHRRKER